MVDFAAIKARMAAAKQSAPAITNLVPSGPAPLSAVVSPSPSSPRKESKLGFELQEKVLALQQALLDRHPRMPVLLREIHTTLRAQPENVTLFSEEEIAILVDGLKVQTGVEFAASITKPSGKSAAIAKIKTLGIGAF